MAFYVLSSRCFPSLLFSLQPLTWRAAKQKRGKPGKQKWCAPRGCWKVFMKFIWKQEYGSQSVIGGRYRFDGDVVWHLDTQSSLSTLISRQLCHPGRVCPMSFYESSCSSRWTLGWLHHRLKSRWKFPKLLFPLCRIFDLHFPGLSDRFVTGYLLLPCMTNLLLRVLVGNTNRECEGRKDWEKWWNKRDLLCSCLHEDVFCNNKSHIICHWKVAIITGDAQLIPCKRVPTHMKTLTKVSFAPQALFFLSRGSPSGSFPCNVFDFNGCSICFWGFFFR